MCVWEVFLRKVKCDENGKGREIKGKRIVCRIKIVGVIEIDSVYIIEG